MSSDRIESTDAPTVRVLRVDALQRSMPLRMPFRFGAVTMTELTEVCLQVEFECYGRRAVGHGCSVLSPAWFDKSPDRDYPAKTQALTAAIALARVTCLEASPTTAIGLHRAVQPIVRARCAASGIPALTSSFGVALIDSAIVDGMCRLWRSPLHEALRGDLFGFGAVPGLRSEPIRSMQVRHTVGLGDPLTQEQIVAPLDDGLPESLEDVVRSYGVRYFKIKIGGDTEANLRRLRAITAVLQREAVPGYRAVLDGNESFADGPTFVAFVAALTADPGVRPLFDRLLWIEQPMTRDAALDDSAADVVRRVSAVRPLILDESDGTDETVERAIQLGYAGVSAKNCKGVFRTLHSSRMLWAHPGGILAAEDLTHPPLAPLHQDSAVVASLGVEHAERNGHHYVRGLDHLPATQQAAALRDYPSLYERTAHGLVRLRIRDGAIDLGEVNAAPYGMVEPVDVTGFDPLPLPTP